jgi:HCOMODA/2-hydroxy-3-carboxy-muconic semialdehyde decarboxylase
MNLDAVLDDLIAANRILAHEGVVDAFGHVSIRHPLRPDRYLMSRNRSPAIVERADIMEFALDGAPIDARGRRPYGERFIHGALYERRADIHAVVHSHSPSVIPFGVTGESLRPLMHTCATIGSPVPVWEPRAAFGDTDMLVATIDIGRDLARSFDRNRAALMRGHGATAIGRRLREAVYTAIYLEVNAKLQSEAMRLTTKPITFLSDEEIGKIVRRLDEAKPNEGYDKAWENWCARAGVEYRPDPALTDG